MDNVVATTDEETGTDIILMPCTAMMCAIAFTTTAIAVENITTEAISEREDVHIERTASVAAAS